MHINTVVFVCLLATATATGIDFKNCAGTNQTLHVDISPCPQQPCVFTYNNTATVKVTFKAPSDSGSLKAQIYGIVMGVRVPWEMPDPDGCKSCGIHCPVVKGNVYTYVNTLAVPKQAPKIRLIVEWQLTGSAGEKQFCFDFPMEIS